MMKYIRRAAVLSLTVALLLSSAQALTLRYNQRGDEVKALQKALSQLGFYQKTLDGVYGSGTKTAVRNFQKANGLSVDGVAGPVTLSWLEAMTGIDIDGGSGNQGGNTGNTGNSGSAEKPPIGEGLFGGVYTTIKYGDKGDRVRTLQRALLALGYQVGKVDGSFGSGTYAAVRDFQRSEKLGVDGKAGKQTLKKLETYFDENGNLLGGSGGTIVPTPPVEDEDNGPEYGIPTRTLRLGMSGDDVKYTQQRLKELDYYTGALDGTFSTAMRTAVKAFQTKNNLSADGVIGPATRKVLFSADALGANDKVFRTLKLGMEGEDVGALQLRLMALGYFKGTADGVFDNDTMLAVAEFQLANGLTVNGVVDETTHKKAYSNSAIPKEEEKEEEDDPVIPNDTLEMGESGAAVKSLQLRLKELGYYTGTADGSFSSSTYAAVKAFQQRNGLNVDGKAGKYTLALLYSDDAIAADDDVSKPDKIILPERILRQGMVGDDVKSVQTRLQELGYYKGTLHGEFDKKTLLAVRAFQQNNNLLVDGAAGPNTCKLLFSEKAISAPADTSIIPTRDLTIGDTGDDVKAVQQRLRNLGFYTSQVDGTYGGSTTDAMKRFQEMNGLYPSGDGNLATYARLFSDDALNDEGVLWGTDGPDYTNLKTGSTGAAVTRLQQKLRELLYDVDVTGTYDAKTKAAVIKFQKLNGLSADGIAGKATQTRLYSGNAVTGDKDVSADSGDHGEGVVPVVSTGNGRGPADVRQVKWLMWIDEIKPQLGSADILLVYEPSTNTSYRIRVYARGKHLDAEPYTIDDTALMKAAWGGKFAWDEKPVYVRLPSGVWCIASTHSMPHEENGITTNGFYGHLCVHFPRTMQETIAAGDTKNGVRHQNDIRKHWEALTGEKITW